MASCGVAASSRATSGPATSSRTACSTWSSAFSSGSATCREGTITDEQVQNLLYNQQARAALFEVTGGDPDSVDENTVPEVIARLEERIRTPLREEVQLERDEAQRARARQRAEARGAHGAPGRGRQAARRPHAGTHGSPERRVRPGAPPPRHRRRLRRATGGPPLDRARPDRDSARPARLGCLGDDRIVGRGGRSRLGVPPLAVEAVVQDGRRGRGVRDVWVLRCIRGA